MMKKILLVDDDIDSIKLLKIRLVKLGMDVTCAYNGQEAFDILKASYYDLTIMDLKMPVLDGYELCSLLENSKDFKKTPILIITACLIKKPKLLLLQLKAKGLFFKPYDPNLLIKSINNIISLN
jgi:CheY-like chemotaxis protein